MMWCVINNGSIMSKFTASFTFNIDTTGGGGTVGLRIVVCSSWHFFGTFANSQLINQAPCCLSHFIFIFFCLYRINSISLFVCLLFSFYHLLLYYINNHLFTNHYHTISRKYLYQNDRCVLVAVVIMIVLWTIDFLHHYNTTIQSLCMCKVGGKEREREREYNNNSHHFRIYNSRWQIDNSWPLAPETEKTN